MPVSAFARGNNPAGTTVSSISEGDKMETNEGTVTDNHGTVTYNSGTVETNESSGTVVKNGTVGNNDKASALRPCWASQ